jgi:hypothetical protein
MLFFQHLKFNISLVYHQQAVAEHWELADTEIFQPKDVASGNVRSKQRFLQGQIGTNVQIVITRVQKSGVTCY